MDKLVRWFKRHSLKWRLSLLFTSGMLLLLLFFSIFIFWSTLRLVYHHEQRLINQKATAIASDLTTEISEESNLEYDYLTRLLINYSEENQSILLLDSYGNQLASAIGSEWDREPEEFEGKVLFAQQPVELPFSPYPLMVQIMETTAPLQWYFNILSTILFLSSLFTILLSSLGGYMLSKWGLKPLDQLIEQIHSISPQRLSQRLHHNNVENEIYELIQAFNQLLDRMEETLVSQQRFVADASHELRTPLSIIEGYVSLLQRWGKDKPEVREEALAALKQESTRLFRLIEDLLSLAKLQDFSHSGEEIRIQPLTPLLLEAKRAWLTVYPPPITLTFEWEESLCLAMDREKIRRLLDILLDNARKYTEQGEVKVRAYSEQEWIHIRVEDTGIGIPAKDIPHIFKRFYRVDKSRNRKKGGSGLGLAIAQSIVDDHQGSIRIEPSATGGTLIEVLFKKELCPK